MSTLGDAFENGANVGVSEREIPSL
jgi:hypothetical protein